ncbi:hypothetical protein YC2023_045858 [Brassica napus]
MPLPNSSTSSRQIARKLSHNCKFPDSFLLTEGGRCRQVAKTRLGGLECEEWVWICFCLMASEAILTTTKPVNSLVHRIKAGKRMKLCVISKSGDAQLDLLILDIIYKDYKHISPVSITA